MLNQAFTGAQGARVFISSIPGETFPGQQRERDKRDQKLRADLEAHLTPLHIQGLITVWHPGKLSRGKAWEREIAAHLEVADIIILLLSAQFLADTHCRIQMDDALARSQKGKVRIIPILLHPVDVRPLPIGQLAFSPIHGGSISQAYDEDRAWYEVVKNLRNIIEAEFPSSHTYLPMQKPAYRNVINESPPAPYHGSIIQRPRQIAEISRLLAENDNTAVVLTGLGGVGKTVLSTQIYYERQPCSLWLDIEATVTLTDVIGSLCKAIGLPLPPFENLTIQALAQELFTIVRNTAYLIIFDGFETWLDIQTSQANPKHTGVDQWLTLLNSSPQTCAGRILLTSRFYPHRAFHYPGRIQEFSVPSLDTTESIQLLHLGGCPSIEQASVQHLSMLAQHSQGHALTLAWLRDLLKRDAGLTPAKLLQVQYHRNLWVSDAMIETLNSIYRDYLNQDQRDLLLAFAVYREAVPFEAALEVIDPLPHSSDHKLDAARLVLLNQGLLQIVSNKGYRSHSVVTDFLQERYLCVDRQKYISAHRHAAHYYQKQDQNLLISEKPHQDIDDLHAIIEIVWHLCQAEQQQEAYDLIMETGLFSDLHRWGNNATLLTIYQELLTLENWQPRPSLIAHIHNEMGEIYNALGQKDRAFQEYKHAMTLFRQIGEQKDIVEVLNNLGAIYRTLEELPKAMECYQEALRICEIAADRIIWQGRTLNNLGKFIYEEGIREQKQQSKKKAKICYRKAVSYYKQALAWYQDNQSPTPTEEAFILNNLADVYQALGQYQQARKYYWHALQCFQEKGDRRNEAMTLNNLGLLYQNIARQGESKMSIEETRMCCEQALRIFREVGDRRQEQTVLRNLGRFYIIYQKQDEYKRYKKSLACFVAARKISEELRSMQGANIPMWIENTIRKGLGNQQFENLLRELDKDVEKIIEDILTD